MSGGSYDYVYQKIDQIEIKDCDIKFRRKAFQKLLKLVATAMHDIEWVDSGDYSEGEENPAIMECFEFLKIEPCHLKAYYYDELKFKLKTLFEGIEND